jgi:hypothetical protein
MGIEFAQQSLDGHHMIEITRLHNSQFLFLDHYCPLCYLMELEKIFCFVLKTHFPSSGHWRPQIIY